MDTENSTITHPERHRPKSDVPFYIALLTLSGVYVVLLASLLVADAAFSSPGHVLAALADPNIQYAIKLSLFSCTLTTILSLWTAVPIGYLFSRYRFPGKSLLDALLDVPIVLPPLVIGLSLLILFRTRAGQAADGLFEWVTDTHITYSIPAVILAQYMVACAFAVRTMRATFDHINPRQEEVALTSGCSRSQAFWMVVLPEARRGLIVAATLAWARSLGEFGPILVFAGATRKHTEVLPTTVFLELSVGNIEAAVAVSLLMVVAAVFVLLIVRFFGGGGLVGEGIRP